MSDTQPTKQETQNAWTAFKDRFVERLERNFYERITELSVAQASVWWATCCPR